MLPFPFRINIQNPHHRISLEKIQTHSTSLTIGRGKSRHFCEENQEFLTFFRRSEEIPVFQSAWPQQEEEISFMKSTSMAEPQEILAGTRSRSLPDGIRTED
jgi:hypothetical protein